MGRESQYPAARPLRRNLISNTIQLYFPIFGRGRIIDSAPVRGNPRHVWDQNSQFCNPRHLNIRVCVFYHFFWFSLFSFVCTPPAITSWLLSKPENLWRAGADTSLNHHQIVRVMDAMRNDIKTFYIQFNLGMLDGRDMCDIDWSPGPWPGVSNSL